MADMPPRADGPDQASAAEPRETAATTTALIVNYVRHHGGEAAVHDLLAAADLRHTAAELTDPARWYSYETRIRLFEAATEVLDDPEAAFKIGATALENNLAPAIVLLVRALGSPRQVYRQLPSAVTKFSTTSTMEVVEAGSSQARISFRLHAGYRHSRLDCAYAQGLISTVPTVFSLEPARIEHPACQSDGHDACIYDLSWQARRRPWQRSRRDGADTELKALRAQLASLQSTASDLVGSHDLDQALTRIIERAASAVIAPAYLLAVETPGADTPLVHRAGLDPVTAEDMAIRLLGGEDLGPHVVVVDVATARRQYGRLAAVYAADQRGLRDERSLLSAYAAHAAAALELVLALDTSRRDEARARDLLTLAHQLSVTTSEQEIADVVVRMTPTISGAPRASLLAWDAGRGSLRGLAAHGGTEQTRATLLETELRPDETSELARMLTRRRPTVLRSADVSPVLRSVLEALDTETVVVVPLLAGDTLLGVLTATENNPAPPGWPDAEAVERLSGIADQAATALQNAHLVTRIRHQAQHDGLTGLPNRALFMHTLEREIATSESDGGVAVLFCDLDGFKQVNDQYGHAAGDELLRQVAARLRAHLRPGDLVARLSGDEFALLLRGGDLDLGAGDVANRITDGFSAPFRVDGRELRISTSIGVAVQRASDDGGHLLRRADAAMYVAKQRGRNQIVLDGETPRGGTTSRRSAAQLRAGLDAGEFALYYQPIVRLTSDLGEPRVTVVGQEALARWCHPELGVLAPAAFLALAEESGHVADLDLWAVRSAVAAAVDWAGSGHPFHVAVNLSAQTLIDPRLRACVREALSANDLEAGSLTLEVTESRALVDLPGVVEQLTQLRQLGVRIALDDFGTGFSTLTWLQRLPIDQVKLDRSFVATLDGSDRAAHLVEGVVALARSLDIEVVAEGVERETHLRRLHAVGCELAQGYLFGRPTPTAMTEPSTLH
ncbi:putative bifunctional diguanylate cyclase/phosphodiesterase [Egicoccus sp. AB-alg6-2]|uniref:putative bifunctional diguanylate cyclase/phosphodiesterase n=1 Tax=Egicoccus sp. AB-alg6-2 TaxID=3242692 RepID=UPI00359E85C2